jgi:hypothetical protein
MVVVEWPSRSETTLSSMPAASARLALVCRRSCSRIGGRPCDGGQFQEMLRDVLRSEVPPVLSVEDESLVVPSWFLARVDAVGKRISRPGRMCNTFNARLRRTLS